MAKRKPESSQPETVQAQSDFAAQVELKQPIVVVLDFAEAWAVLSAIQLAAAHPDALGPLHAYAVDAGAKLQRQVSKTPALGAVAAAGWHKPEPT